MADTATLNVSIDVGPGAVGLVGSLDGVIESIQIGNAKLPGTIISLPTGAPTVLPFGPLASAALLVIVATAPITLTRTVNGLQLVENGTAWVFTPDQTKLLTAASIQGITAGTQVDWIVAG